jgi:hypothetical protein
MAEIRNELLCLRAAIGRRVRAAPPWLLPARWRPPGSFSRPRPEGAGAVPQMPAAEG